MSLSLKFVLIQRKFSLLVLNCGLPGLFYFWYISRNCPTYVLLLSTLCPTSFLIQKLSWKLKLVFNVRALSTSNRRIYCQHWMGQVHECSARKQPYPNASKGACTQCDEIFTQLYPRPPPLQGRPFPFLSLDLLGGRAAAIDQGR